MNKGKILTLKVVCGEDDDTAWLWESGKKGEFVNGVKVCALSWVDLFTENERLIDRVDYLEDRFWNELQDEDRDEDRDEET